MNIENQLVVNWHTTKQCNYHCRGCFSQCKDKEWCETSWTDSTKVEELVKNFAKFNKEQFGGGTGAWRLNIVGGEPLLPEFNGYLTTLVSAASNHGAKIGLITNGSHLRSVIPIIDRISCIGISIDSFSHETNLKIGRAIQGQTLLFQHVARVLQEIKSKAPEIHIKINTVVNKDNYTENLIDSVSALPIGKYKILRQLPFGACRGISDRQFETFLRINYRDRLRREDDVRNVFIEDNTDMRGSYLMIAPNGCLFDNSDNGYTYSSKPISDMPLSDALKELHFSMAAFRRRYSFEATDDAVKKFLDGVSSKEGTPFIFTTKTTKVASDG